MAGVLRVQNGCSLGEMPRCGALKPQAAEQGVHEAQYFYAATFDSQCLERFKSARYFKHLGLSEHGVSP